MQISLTCEYIPTQLANNGYPVCHRRGWVQAMRAAERAGRRLRNSVAISVTQYNMMRLVFPLLAVACVIFLRTFSLGPRRPRSVFQYATYVTGPWMRPVYFITFYGLFTLVSTLFINHRALSCVEKRNI